jgi:divalent metal cation (Fe/Co/Zn/Cd) transporter
VSHLRGPDGSVHCLHEADHEPEQVGLRLVKEDREEHEHPHGLVDRTILRSRAGIRAVSWSLAILTITAVAQAFIYSRTLSVALLADLIHNFGDALTAIPLGLAFFFRSVKGERLAETIERFIHPRSLSQLWLLAAAGVIGFVGNEIAAQVRLRAGRKLQSPALVADGQHARVDGFVSLGVLASATVVALGLNLADPIIGLVITAVILHITWESWHTISTTDPGEMLEHEQH